MSRAERDAADLVETMLRLDDHSPASSLQLSPYHRGAGEDDEDYASGANQPGGLPRYVRDWATGDGASASGGRMWPIDSLEHALELELDIQEADMRLAQAEQHAQQAEMHVHLLQEANASLASERSTLLQRAVTAERALGTEREALVHRALTAEQATCALMEQHARDTAASSAASDARLARLEEECAAERERFALEAREHSNAKDRASQLQAECKNLQMKIEGLQEQVQLGRTGAEQLRRDKEAAEAALQEAREEVESLRTDLGRTNFRLGDMQDMLHRLQSSLDEETTARLAAEESAAQAGAELQIMRQKLQQAETAAMNEAEKAERSAEDAERSAQHAERTTQQLAQAQAAQQEALRAQAELQADLEEARGQIGPAKERAHRAEEEMDAAQAALHDALAAQGHLQAALDNARDEAALAKESMQNALEEAQHEAQRAEHADEQQRLAQASAEQSQADAMAAQQAKLDAGSQLQEALQSNKELCAALQHLEQDRDAQTARLSAQLEEVRADAECAAAAAAAEHAKAYAELEDRTYRDLHQVEEAKDHEIEGILQQMQRLKEEAAAELHSASEREAALAADVRNLEAKLAEQQMAAQAAAEDAASRLSGVEQAAAEDRERLQEQIALLEQKLSEATAIQEDLATRLQESNSLRHQAVEDQQSSSQEVADLRQQLSDLHANVLQPLQAEHGDMLAALSMVTQLCADQAPAESPQTADRAHLMAPAVHHADGTASPGSATGSPYSPRVDTPSDAPTAGFSTPVDASEAAEAAVSSVQQHLSQAQAERAALLEAKIHAEAQLDDISARSAAAHREYQAALEEMQHSAQSMQERAADADAQWKQRVQELQLDIQHQQALQKETREALEAEVCQLSTERDTLAQQSEAQHAQCQQQLADLETLKLELAAAHEGKHQAELQHREAEAAHDRALAFAREESDQALALVCADLAALQSLVTACTAALTSALAGVGSVDSDGRAADCSLETLPSQDLSTAEQGAMQLCMSTGSQEAEVKCSEEAASELKCCTEAAADCIKRAYVEAAALKDEVRAMESRLSSASDDCHRAQQQVELLTEQLAESAAQRSQQAEELKQDLDEQRSSLQLELEDSRKIASALQTSQVQLQARLSMLQQEGAALQDAHKSLEQAHAELQGQMQAAEENAERLCAELTTGAAARQALQAELAQAGASLDTERLLRAQAQEELAAARQAGADMERQLHLANRGAAKVGELEKALQEAEGSAEQLQDRADAAEDALAEARADVARQTATNKTLLSKLAASRAAAQQTAAILEVARTEAEDLQACLQHEQEEVRRLEMLCETERETVPEEAQRQLADAGVALSKALEECRAVLRQNRQMQAEKEAALLEKEAAKQQAAHLQKAIEGLTKPRIKAIHNAGASSYEMPHAKEQLRECSGCSAKSARICELRKALAAALDGQDSRMKEEMNRDDQP